MARMRLEGQLDMVEYSRITIPDSVHMIDPANSYMEMLKTRNSAMAWSENKKRAGTFARIDGRL